MLVRIYKSLRLSVTGATKIIVADVIKGRLELAMKMGADVTIDCSEKDLLEEVMAITDGNGVSRLMEASGNHNMVNSSFKMMRKAWNVSQIYYDLVVDFMQILN